MTDDKENNDITCDIPPDDVCEGCDNLSIGGSGLTHWYECAIGLTPEECEGRDL